MSNTGWLLAVLAAASCVSPPAASAQGVKPYLPAGFNPFFAPPEQLSSMGLPQRPVQKPGEDWDSYVGRELGWEKVVFAYDKAHTPRPFVRSDCQHPRGDLVERAQTRVWCDLLAHPAPSAFPRFGGKIQILRPLEPAP